MSNLKCHVYFCRYNDCSMCKHHNPDINERAECVSYSRKSEEHMKDPCMFEYAEDKRNNFDDIRHNICCKTLDCMNNSQTRCTLNNVRIDHNNETAKCMNYRKA